MTKTCEPHGRTMRLYKSDRLTAGWWWRCSEGCDVKAVKGEYPEPPDSRYGRLR